MVVALLTLLLPAVQFGQQQVPEQASLALDISKLPPATEEQSLALETLNGFRALHSLAPVRMDLRLNASAALHASTMAKNSVLTHKDDQAEIASASDRARKYGYDKQVMELVASGMPDSPFAVVTFIDAPYHRRLLLKPGNFEFGCSTNRGFSCFVLGGSVEPQLVLSPPRSSEGVPTSWDGREEPSPMRGTGLAAPYGYPILVSLPGQGTFRLRTASLKDAAGKEISLVVKHPENDTELRDSAILVPKKPLEGSTVYTVVVDFSVDGESRSETWSFKTGAATPVSAKPPKKTKKT